MSSLEDMERRIANLEANYDLLKDVLYALSDSAKLKKANFARLALGAGFKADELQALHDFLGWAVKRDSAELIRRIRQDVSDGEPNNEPRAEELDLTPLTRDEVFREFEARMPQPLQGKLEMIMRAYRDDGHFRSVYQLVLGDEPKKSARNHQRRPSKRRSKKR